MADPTLTPLQKEAADIKARMAAAKTPAQLTVLRRQYSERLQHLEARIAEEASPTPAPEE